MESCPGEFPDSFAEYSVPITVTLRHQAILEQPEKEKLSKIFKQFYFSKEEGSSRESCY